MKLLTTYEFVKQHFPQQLETMLEQKAASSSKSAHFPIEDFEFYFYVGITSYPCPNPFIDPSEDPAVQRECATEEEFKEDLLSRMGGGIQAKKNRCLLYSGPVDFDSVLPESVTQFLEDSWQEELERREDRKRFESLSEDEKNEEIRKLVESLTKGKGFISI